MVMKFRQ